MGRLIKGIDIREHGSGNPGATNVFRTVGKSAGIITLLIDALKGYLPAFIVMQIAPHNPLPATVAGLSAIAGHNWTFLLNFRGGKGVATSAGFFMAILPGPTGIALACFALTLALTKRVSLSSMTGSASLCISVWFITGSIFYTGLAVACALLILVMHRRNIGRLIRNEEPKISFRGNK